jgi:hypothetical protein
MRLPTKFFWEWWVCILEETTTSPKPERATVSSDGPQELTAWEASTEFSRVSRQLDKVRHQHRRHR